MPKIIETFKVSYPKMRLIGKRYADSDHVDGSFGAKWGEWFSKGLFEPIEKLGVLPENENAYLGAMRIVNGEFEYWIGMLFSSDTEEPTDYEYVDIDACNFAICYIYGNEQSGEIYGLDAHNLCLEAIKNEGFTRIEDSWCFEAYNCPRFTTPDKHGNVILDYGIAVEG